jgi:hypothetical protein
VSLLAFSQSAAARRWLDITSAASNCLTIQNPLRFIPTYLCYGALGKTELTLSAIENFVAAADLICILKMIYLKR